MGSRQDLKGTLVLLAGVLGTCHLPQPRSSRQRLSEPPGNLQGISNRDLWQTVSLRKLKAGSSGSSLSLGLALCVLGLSSLVLARILLSKFR